MVKQDLSELSLTQLSELVRGNPRTVRRRLADAGVKPFRVDGRAMYFRPWEALPAICDDAPRPCGAGGGGPAPLDFLLGGGGPLSTMTGAALCRLLHCDWADVRELLSWSLPFVKAGRPDSPRGWVFAFGHVSRWLGLISQALRLHGDDLAESLRRLRSAAGEPLDVPEGFGPLEGGSA